MKRLLPTLFVVIFVISMFQLIYRIKDSGTLWWDEGWTLSAARNWIERGHLGHYLAGEPIPVRIPVRFPIVVSSALSFKILGIGTWQGRLPGAIYTILTFGLVVYLTSKMYNSKVGITSLILLLFSPTYLNPIVIGSQVLAEMPMMFFLFMGYTLMWLAISRSPGWALGAALFFGVAIHAKLQVPPFWAASIISAIYLAYLRGRKRTALTLIYIALGSIVFAVAIVFLQNVFMPDSFDDPELTKILLNTIILVFSWPVRWQATKNILLLAPLHLVGITFSGRYIILALLRKRITQPDQSRLLIDQQDILKAAVWVLGTSWFGWYLFSAMHWPRYLFPPFFIASIFSAEFLHKVTSGLDIRLMVHRISSLVLRQKFNELNSQALILLIILSINITCTIATWIYNGDPESQNPLEVANYLRTNIPAEALIETFESELFFLAPGSNFHFPTDLVSMQLVRKYNLDMHMTIAYDPLEANPGYIIVGSYARLWHLYNPILVQERLDLETEIGGYQIYKINEPP